MSESENKILSEIKLGIPKVDCPREIRVKALDLAILYLGHGLNVKAINTLEELANSSFQTASVYLALGDIYRNCSLNIQAKDRYTKAIDIAASGDNQVLVAAKAGLAKIEAVLGKKTEANRLLQEARDGFKALEDVTQWSELDERLSGLDSEDKLLFLSDCKDCKTSAGLNGRWIRNPDPVCKACPSI